MLARRDGRRVLPATCTDVGFDMQVWLIAVEFAWQVCREYLRSVAVAWETSSVAARVACGSAVQGCARGHGDASIATLSGVTMISSPVQVFPYLLTEQMIRRLLLAQA